MKFIKTPESQFAVYGGSEVVRFDCTACAHLLTFIIKAVDNESDFVRYVCDGTNTGGNHEVKKWGIKPLNCTLFIHTALLGMTSELVVECKVANSGSYLSSSAILTLVKTGRELKVFLFELSLVVVCAMF